jgi:hypothetical protein
LKLGALVEHLRFRGQGLKVTTRLTDGCRERTLGLAQRWHAARDMLTTSSLHADVRKFVSSRNIISIVGCVFWTAIIRGPLIISSYYSNTCCIMFVLIG